MFLKDTLSLKPKITQNIFDGGVSAQFVLDMGNSDYTVNTTPGLMTNKLTLLGTDAPQGNFDATAPTQTFNIANAPTPHITGGLYTYTAGTGWSGSGATATYDKGSYTYAESGSVNLTTLDWNSFRDPADNLMDFGGTLAERKRGGNICKGGTATTPPAGC